ncbi:MAG: ribonuclease P protein component [Bernardetiaceae bacterium]|nr:ribonuclease P protein component [Bernardetiaceae bacterium]
MNTLPKSLRLCSRKLIDSIFKEGASVFSYPFKVLYQKSDKATEDTEPLQRQVLISVPKRYRKKAVDRNRIKRQIKEIYRLHHKDFLKPHKNIKHIAIIFVGKDNFEYATLHRNLHKAIKKIPL